MEGKRRGPIFEYLYLTWIVVRVVIIVLLWLAIILGIFVGYLTLPIVVITLFIAAHAIFDATGLLARRSNGRK